jgi:hypothetical protein
MRATTVIGRTLEYPFFDFAKSLSNRKEFMTPNPQQKSLVSCKCFIYCSAVCGYDRAILCTLW